MATSAQHQTDHPGPGALDRELFEAIADTPTPLLDTVMPPLTRAADHSKLWFAMAAGLLASRSQSAQRGAVRGVVTLGAASLFTNQVAKRIRQRPRPLSDSVPLARRVRRRPTSNSLPSGHSASAAAFAIGVGLENPPLGLGFSVLAALVGLSRVATGVHYPGDVPAGFGIGAGVAVLGGRLVPPIIETALPKTEPFWVQTPQRPDGSGVVLVVNPASGSGTGPRSSTRCVRACRMRGSSNWPRATTRSGCCARRPHRPKCWRSVAVTARWPPPRRRRLTRDCRWRCFPPEPSTTSPRTSAATAVAQTIDAIRRGSVARVDLLCLNESQMVINTASIGAYPKLVRYREKLEKRIGKPLASMYAMLHTLRKDQPVRIRYDNKTLQTSLLLIGNSVYLPAGFAPSRRTRMDDGLIDVRILETGRRLATVRILTALALGRLQRSPLYHELQVPEFSFSTVDAPTVLAHDGEVGEQYDQASFTAKYRVLAVFRPGPGRLATPSVSSRTCA
ncbi:PAP2 superfamily protein [Mycobacterium ulcerans str. Harvey]|uniref:PAP2 superfamily protein n=1 Tax=Mycobacterium ulcerans str. Harvey TaxID=1299332 RepID=A0ABN0QZC6_MYCUL|nr:PAP2 superfamily protein [Mycobacterium ulcerans str. Harvey]